MRYRYLIALLIAVIGFLIVSAYSVAEDARPLLLRHTAQCDTDSDCLRLCDPADAECDGGPQS